MLLALSVERRFRVWTLVGVLIIVVGAVLAHKPALRLFYPLHYSSDIERYSAANGLDPRLVAAIIRVESRFDPMVESAKGARGLMQVLPGTGSWVAEKIGLARYHPDMLYEPETSIRLGSWYLAYLLDRFDGRTAVALAAYNGGTTNVQLWLDSGIWDGTVEHADDIPFEETRSYVRRIMRDYLVYRWVYAE